MKRHLRDSKRIRPLALSVFVIAMLGLVLSPPTASAQKLVIKPVAEKKVKQLPAGPLYWRIENFTTLAEAQTAAGPTGLVAEVVGKAWLLTLAPQGGSSPGGSTVTEIGPVPIVTAPEYLLRINRANGPPGAKTRVHSHARSETFYYLTGTPGQKQPEAVSSA